MSRVAALLLVIACGGGDKPSTTTVSNTSGASDPMSGTTAQPSPVEQGARVVARTAKGGEIEMSSLDGAPFEEAKEHMARHCGNEHSLIQTTERRNTGRTTLVDGKPEPVYVVRMTYACAP